MHKKCVKITIKILACLFLFYCTFLVFMCVLFGFAGHTFGTNTPIKSIGGCCCDDGGISLT